MYFDRYEYNSFERDSTYIFTKVDKVTDKVYIFSSHSKEWKLIEKPQ